ncbi:hypothetical protein L2E82_00014 [Cichorium intybus]|uniref:Uncharacterized protein n=1 Tax=Cichorium intybus TaxID=13427 RepID=A0ACB9GX66_CICIN|nr:hypothetical protein L2E82_00014 [Cichorium intybus]
MGMRTKTGFISLASSNPSGVLVGMLEADCRRCWALVVGDKPEQLKQSRVRVVPPESMLGVASPFPNVDEWWGWVQVAGGDGVSGGGRWSVLRAIIVTGDDGVTGEESLVGGANLRRSRCWSHRNSLLSLVPSCVCDEVPETVSHSRLVNCLG